MTQSLMEQSQYDRGLREQALAHLQMDLSDEQLDEIFVNDRELFEAMEEQANRHAVGREPGFLDRAAQSFAGSKQGEVNILRDRGVDAYLDPSGQVRYRQDDGRMYQGGRGGAGQLVDPPRAELGDIADATKDVGVGVAGLFGSRLGPKGTAIATGAADAASRKIGREMGSGEESAYGSSILAGLGAGAADKVIGKGLQWAKGRWGEGVRDGTRSDVTEPMERIDKKYGTKIKEKAPIDVMTESDWIGSVMQRIRESPYTKKVQEFIDAPFQDQLTAALQQMQKLVGKSPGTLAAASDVGAATRGALAHRTQEASNAYKAFQAVAPHDLAPPLEATRQAAKEIAGSEFMGRQGGFAGEGFEDVTKALQLVSNAKTFKDLESLRLRLGDRIPDAARKGEVSSGAIAQLKQLEAAVLKDVEDFLDSVPGDASKLARNYKDMVIGLRGEAKFGVQNLLKESNLPDLVPRLTRLNINEIDQLKELMGAAPGYGGLAVTKEGTDAWNKLVASVFEELRSKSYKATRTSGGELIVDGLKLKKELERYKPEALETLFGAEMANDVRAFAEMTARSQSRMTKFANPSGTAAANDQIKSILDFFIHPKQAAVSLVGRLAAFKGAGAALSNKGVQDVLLGRKDIQNQNTATVLRQAPGVIGRALGYDKLKDVVSTEQDPNARRRSTTRRAVPAGDGAVARSDATRINQPRGLQPAQSNRGR